LVRPPGPDPNGSIAISGSTPVERFFSEFLEDWGKGGLRSLESYLSEFPAELAPAIKAAFHARSPESSPGDHTFDEMSPQSIGPYRIVEELGRGGQGLVYLAEDTRRRRRVALKVLTSWGAATEQVVERFRREAAIASRLEHPGICTVYETGTAQGVPYMAMRLVEGESLSRRIAAASADPDTATASFVELDTDVVDTEADAPSSDTSARTTQAEILRIATLMEAAARALHAAHEAGVIHRDIKPGNIMVTPDGDPVLLDFGLARETDGDDVSLTRTGDLFGTPAYMAPEQLLAKRIRVDRRADVWALGVTLFECLCLKRPFDAPTREGLYQQILYKDPPDLRTLNKSIPKDLAVIVQTATDKDRDRRYQTALDLAEDLRRFRTFEPIQAKPVGQLTKLVRWTQRNPAVATLTAALFLAMATGLIWIWSQRTELQAKTREAEANLAEWERLADGRRLDDLVAEAEGSSSAYDRWVTRAQALTTKLPQHGAALEALRAEGSKAPEGDSWSFNDEGDQLRHDKLRDLVAGLQALAGEPSPTTVTLAGLKQKQVLFEAQRNPAAWQRCRDDVARGDSPYKGLKLKPIPGLAPLGRDRDSGLWEFWHVDSGERPQWEGEPFGLGKVKLHADSGAEGLVMVLIPGGTFRMGAMKPDEDHPAGSPNVDADAGPDEGPVHDVTLDPYLISKYEVTQGQWMRRMGENPSMFRPGGELLDATQRWPVEQVTWTRCVEACRRWGLSLPTESQWERACRGGTTTRFSTGDDLESLTGHANINAAASVRAGHTGTLQREFDDGFINLAPVGALKPNPFGLHDVHGNVREWCLDGYLGYGEEEPRAGDGLRGLVQGARLRVFRGGSFRSVARFARSADRVGVVPGGADSRLGLRPARRITP